MSPLDVTVEFVTAAPPDAPEVKGTVCYFRPESLTWRVTSRGVHVRASGPSTRIKNRAGEMGWSVEGRWGAARGVASEWVTPFAYHPTASAWAALRAALDAYDADRHG